MYRAQICSMFPHTSEKYLQSFIRYSARENADVLQTFPNKRITLYRNEILLFDFLFIWNLPTIRFPVHLEFAYHLQVHVPCLTLNQYFLCMHWWFSKTFKKFSLPDRNNQFIIISLQKNIHLMTQSLQWISMDKSCFRLQFRQLF
jgi:hypothetical protein